MSIEDNMESGVKKFSDDNTQKKITHNKWLKMFEDNLRFSYFDQITSFNIVATLEYYMEKKELISIKNPTSLGYFHGIIVKITNEGRITIRGFQTYLWASKLRKVECDISSTEFFKLRDEESRRLNRDKAVSLL
ncbi:MAG: hypothetical protein V1692_01980 [bacterium]